MENRMESKFNGGLLGLIGVQIFFFIIVFFTFGLGTPWAVCFKERWYVKHTIIDGRKLNFDGNGFQLFGKYLLWLFLTFITCGIYGFWLGIKLKQWVISHTHIA